MNTQPLFPATKDGIQIYAGKLLREDPHYADVVL